jgi:hypothetical protein
MHSNSDTTTPLTDVPAVEHERSSKETAVANFFSDLVSIHDWIKVQWTSAARGRDDLATVAYSSYAARELARQVLRRVGVEIGWKDPIFLDYAQKAGLLSNENEYVSAGEHSTVIVLLRNQTRVRWHVYSNVGEHMQAPNPETSIGSGVLAQLERWLFCAAISGWDVDQELTVLQDRCLLVALTTQMHTILQYEQSTFGSSSLGSTLEQLKSFSERLHSLKFSPDPWTLSHIIAQTMSLIHYQEIDSSIDRLCAAVYGEKYRVIAENSSETILQKDFGCLLPTSSLNTVPELALAWKMQQTQPARMKEKINSMPWTLKLFEAEHIPIMFSELNSSDNYVSMLDEIRSRVSKINGLRLNIRALPLPSNTWSELALHELADARLSGPLYCPARTMRYGSSLMLV